MGPRGPVLHWTKGKLMCFRPADASAAAASKGVNKCSKCGKQFQTMGGIVLTECPFCEVPFVGAAEESTLPAMSTPSIPAPPGERA